MRRNTASLRCAVRESSHLGQNNLQIDHLLDWYPSGEGETDAAASVETPRQGNLSMATELILFSSLVLVLRYNCPYGVTEKSIERRSQDERDQTCCTIIFIWHKTEGRGQLIVERLGISRAYTPASRTSSTVTSRTPPKTASALWGTSPSVPGPVASLFQALTNKERWEQKKPTPTTFTAKADSRIHQHTLYAHKNVATVRSG